MASFKVFRNIYFLITFLCTVSVFGQNNFEGKVVFRISEEESGADVDYFVKDNKMRMEMKSEEGSMVILFDQKESTTYMIMPEQQMYMEFKGMDYTKDKIDPNESASDTDIKRTGEFKEINGYNCEKWIVKEDDDIVEAWMTDEIGAFFMMSNPMAGNNKDKWQQELMGNYFPMRVDLVEGAEKKKVLEVLSVNKMSLNNDLFSVPPGFQKFDMPNMDMYNQD